MSWHADRWLADPPVPGDPSDFASTAARLRQVAWSVVDAGTALDRLFAGIDGVRGRAAAALGGRVGALTTGLADAVATLEQVAGELDRHADALDELAQRAAAADTQARAAHDELRDAELRQEAAQRALDRAASVLADAQARVAGDGAGDELAVAERAYRRRRHELAWWQAEVPRRAEAFAQVLAQLSALADAAHELTRRTAGALEAATFPTADGQPQRPGARGGVLAQLWGQRVAALQALFAAATADPADLTGQFEQLATALVRRLAPLGAAVSGPLLDSTIEWFGKLPRQRQVDVLAVAAALARVCAGGQRRAGDRGGTYDVEAVGPWVPTPAMLGLPTAADRGAGVVTEALRLTGRADLIGPDEFGLVRVDDRRYVVVLPGVTDLSSPDLGLDATHRTVRDVDVYAIPSSLSTSVAGNRYARMVAEGLQAAGVPIGADVMLVGHSFGADTALDLAADPLFNGAAGFNVTHAVAAGYYSDPQLPHVPPSTRVLVLQNARDEVVNLERLAYRPAAATVDMIDAVGHTTRRDWVGVVASLADASGELADAGVDLATRMGGIPPLVGLPDNPLGPRGAATVGVTTPRPNQVHAVFDGGRRGWGHHQANYTAYARDADASAVAAFHASVAEAGYDAFGQLYTVDVSVPTRPRVDR